MKVDKVLEELEKNRMQPNIQLESIDYIKNKAKQIKAKKYLEIGLFNGYSALHMSAICDVTSLEISTENIKLAKENIMKAEVKNIKIIEGDAKNSLVDLFQAWERFDVVLIDAMKSEYKIYLELSLKLLNKNGIIFADNTISHKEKMKDFFGYLEKNKLKWKEVGIGRGLVEIEK